MPSNTKPDAGPKAASSQQAVEAAKGKKSTASPLDQKGSKEKEDIQEKYLRLYAEFENYKRRTTRDRANWISYASERVIVALLPVLDDFERALSTPVSGDDAHKAFRNGVQLICDKFFKVLQQQGLCAMKVAQGDSFDTDFHEALTQIPTHKKELKGKVTQVAEKGYLLGNKVVRVAKVIIGA